jgi:hypothetical protein
VVVGEKGRLIVGGGLEVEGFEEEGESDGGRRDEDGREGGGSEEEGESYGGRGDEDGGEGGGSVGSMCDLVFAN